MALCTSKKILFYDTHWAVGVHMWEGFQFYRTIEVFMEAGFILLREMNWSIQCWRSPLFSPLKTECSYFSSPSRVTRLTLKSIRFSSSGNMTSGAVRPLWTMGCAASQPHNANNGFIYFIWDIFGFWLWQLRAFITTHVPSLWNFMLYP